MPMIEVTVVRLGLDSSSNSYVVILREKDGQRLLPIWIGQPEAESIVNAMNQIKPQRPNAHDLGKAFIVGLGGALRRVTITRVENNTYYAEMQIDGFNGLLRVDARPSDSIALALRLGAPIFAPQELLTTFDSDEGAADADETAFDLSGEHELTAEQLKAYLENLRPEDFGKFTP